MRFSRVLALVAAVLFVALPVVAEEGERADVDHFPDEWFWGEPEQQAVHQAMVGKRFSGDLPLADVPLEEVSTKAALDRDKIVLIDFWATWCGPCLNAIPTINGLAKKHADDGVFVLGICGERGSETMHETAAEHGMAYATGADADGINAEAWNVMWWPTYALIDRDGIIRAVGLKTEHVGDALAALVEEQPYSPTNAKSNPHNADIVIDVLENGDYSIAGEKVPQESLRARLSELTDDLAGASIVVRADTSVAFEHVVETIDRLKEAGVTNVSMAAAAEE
jgi:biopolymer transport protein ExbD/thiol-disulfide isomerase/thioredoxin